MNENLTILKELRNKTGLGFSKCKEALEKNNWDTEKAEDYLRVHGASVSKLGSRSANEGAVFVWSVSMDSKTMVKLSCETDFVAQNPIFCGAGVQIARTIQENGLETLEESVASEDIQEILRDTMSKVKENVVLSDVTTLSGESIFHYKHSNNSIGVLLDISGGNLEDDDFLSLAHDLCLHITASNPIAVGPEDIPQEIMERETAIFDTQLKTMKKPPAILEGIKKGKVAKFLKTACLQSQPFVKEPKITVRDHVNNTSNFTGLDIKVNKFVRFSK